MKKMMKKQFSFYFQWNEESDEKSNFHFIFNGMKKVMKKQFSFYFQWNEESNEKAIFILFSIE